MAQGRLEQATSGVLASLRRAVRRPCGFWRRTARGMFGGRVFLLHGNTCSGVVGEGVVARVGSAEYRAALSKPHARAMDFIGKALTGFVSVKAAGVASDRALRDWVARGVRFVASLPAKSAPWAQGAGRQPRR